MSCGIGSPKQLFRVVTNAEGTLAPYRAPDPRGGRAPFRNLFIPPSHQTGGGRVDGRRIISGIIFVIRDGLRWRDTPAEYGPPKTIYNRFIRWSRMCLFNRIFAALPAEGGKPDQLMIDATHLNTHRTAASLLKRECSPTYRAHQRRPELQAPCRLRWQGRPTGHAAQQWADGGL